MHSIAKHLGVKINNETGDLILLRESLENMKVKSATGTQYPKADSPKSIFDTNNNPKSIFENNDANITAGNVDLVRENLNRIADKLRVYREIVII